MSNTNDKIIQDNVSTSKTYTVTSKNLGNGLPALQPFKHKAGGS